MDTLVGQYFLDNNQYNSCKTAGFTFDTSGYALYEVIRIVSRTLLFFEDHQERASSGMRKLGVLNEPDWHRLRIQLQQLINDNKLTEGNLKLLVRVNTPEPQFAAYFIPHFYPEESIYRQGVKLICLPVQRPDPHLKQLGISERIRLEIEEIRQKTNAYEVLLVNEKGFITEGSKSNLFLIKDQGLFTAPEDEILRGITRKYVLTVAAQKGLKISETHFNKSDLSKYEAGFICGTSPKVLGIKIIDNIAFNPKNPIIDLISNGYNSIIQEYIERYRL